jgi:phosphoglycerol transferase MdoB-like AlkP superfamily enzyme
VPGIKEHRAGNVLTELWNQRLGRIALGTLPSPLLLILVPACLLALRGRRWVLLLILPLFLGLYAFFPFMLAHYTLIPAPAVLFAMLLGKHVVERAWPIRGPLTAAIIVMCLVLLPGFNSRVHDDPVQFPATRFAYNDLPSKVRTPAVVLFRFQPGDQFHDEPVYNIDALNPDDQQIIRAQDLGLQKDMELFRYYGERQPQRWVYLFDRHRPALVELGRAGELVAAPPSTGPSTRR